MAAPMDDCAPSDSSLAAKITNEQKILRSQLMNLRLKLDAISRYHRKELSQMRHLVFNVPHSSDGIASENSIKQEITGHVKSIFKKKNATPRQASICADSTARLELDRDGSQPALTNPSHTLLGLGGFSHVWLIFVFHENGHGRLTRAKVAPPRLDGAKVGVFSTRSPHRPNPIGLSLAKLDSVQGDTLYLSGVDLLDGTPVLDIKPYIPQYDSPSGDSSRSRTSLESICALPTAATEQQEESGAAVVVKVPAWISDPPIRKLDVRFTATARRQLEDACRCESQSADTVRRSIEQILTEDTRSVYRRNRCQDRLYFFVFSFLHLTSWFDDDCGVVEVVRVRHRVEPIIEDEQKVKDEANLKL